MLRRLYTMIFGKRQSDMTDEEWARQYDHWPDDTRKWVISRYMDRRRHGIIPPPPPSVPPPPPPPVPEPPVPNG